jgi:ABC-2 type transport system ATP-binding protein
MTLECSGWPCLSVWPLGKIGKMDSPSAIAVKVMRVGKAFPTSFGYVSWLKYRGHPPRRTVLTDIGFTVARGELFGLLGANGAGKSTVLRMLAGLVMPDDGAIVIDGVDALAQPLRMRRHIGLCTGEERSFFYRLSARSNLEYFGTLAGLKRGELQERIEVVARSVDLHGELDRRFDQFSSGMRQRLSFARALLADPEVLLLDEPTRAVDPVHAHELRRFVRDELVGRLGKTVILATNLLDEAWELCDRVAVLRAGRIVTIASPSELGRMAAPVRRYAIDLDRIDDALLERMRVVPGLIGFSSAAAADGFCLSIDMDEEPRTLTSLLRVVSANGISIRRVQPQDIRPIDVFARLTGVLDDVR